MTQIISKIKPWSKMAVVLSCLMAANTNLAASIEPHRSLLESQGVDNSWSRGGVVQEPLHVMTRNIYVGANIFRVLSLTDPLLILAEIAAVYQTVQDTDFTARAEVLADEVALHQPHAIGLQEVSLIRRQSPGDVLQGNPIPATEVETDFLQIFLDALAARNLNYVVAASVDNADIELPLFGVVLDDIRLTDRDVLLVRSDTQFQNPAVGNYADNLIVDLSGTQINFNRGWTAADVEVSGITYRVVNTHLEVGSQGAIQALQATELVDMLEGEPLPTLLLGDFNSSPVSPPNEAYDIIATAGFKDVWMERSIDDNDPGYTCCHDETLLDVTTTFTSRIDLAWMRLPESLVTDFVEGTVTGNDPSLRTPSGLWPSDHGGLAAVLAIRADIPDSDNDGVADNIDNCTLVANPLQRDTDGDDFGNYCDADFNQDNVINFVDLAFFASNFGGINEDADLDGDGEVNFSDLALLRTMFFSSPGPSAATGSN